MTDRLPVHLTDDQLNEYLDQGLTPAAHARAGAHLAACAYCTSRLAALGALFASLEALPDDALRRDLAPAVVLAVGRAARHPVAARPTVAPRHPLYRLLFPLQALVAVVLLALTWPLLTARTGDLTLPALSLLSDTLSALQTAADVTRLASEWWAGLQGDVAAGWVVIQDNAALGVPVQLVLAVAAGTGLLWVLTHWWLLPPRRKSPIRRV